MCDRGLVRCPLAMLHIMLSALFAVVILFVLTMPSEKVPPGRLLVWQETGAFVGTFSSCLVVLLAWVLALTEMLVLGTTLRGTLHYLVMKLVCCLLLKL